MTLQTIMKQKAHCIVNIIHELVTNDLAITALIRDRAELGGLGDCEG